MEKVIYIDFPDDFGRQENDPMFSTTLFGEGFQRKPERRQVHRHDFFEMFYFDEGGGELLCDFKRYPIDRHTLVCLSPGKTHGWPVIEGLQGTGIFFSTSFFTAAGKTAEELFQYPFFCPSDSPIYAIPENIASRIGGYFQQMHEEWQTKKSLSIETIRYTLYLLLLECDRTLGRSLRSTNTVNNQIVRSFLIEVEKNYRFQPKVSQLAKKIGVTESKLSAAVKAQFNKTCKQFLTQRLELEAKRLVLDTDLHIAEVGYHLGFEDPSNFSKFIRKFSGLPPSQLREQLRAAVRYV